MLLKDVISYVESKGNEKAMRFEPVTYLNKPLWIVNQIVKIQYQHGGPGMCDYDTALAVGCTSYGKYQLLGANLYGPVCAVPGTIFDFVNDQDEQEKAFSKFVSRAGYDPLADISGWTPDKFSEFAEFYNGPGNIVAYVEQMHNTINTLQTKVL